MRERAARSRSLDEANGRSGNVKEDILSVLQRRPLRPLRRRIAAIGLGVLVLRPPLGRALTDLPLELACLHEGADGIVALVHVARVDVR